MSTTIKNSSKLQSIPLRIGNVWILHFKIWKIRFYNLRFAFNSKTNPFVSGFVYVVVKWHTGIWRVIEGLLLLTEANFKV